MGNSKLAQAFMDSLKAGAGDLLASAGVDQTFFMAVAEDLADVSAQRLIAVATENHDQVQQCDVLLKHIEAQSLSRFAEIELRLAREAREQAKAVLITAVTAVIGMIKL